MRKYKTLKAISLTLLIAMLSLVLFGCKMQLSEDVFTVGNTLKTSHRLIYSIVNQEQDIDGELIFKYVVQQDGYTKMQTYADFETWEYKAEVLFNTKTLLPVSSYKANIYASTKEEDWSVETRYGTDSARISALQEDKVVDKTVDTPSQYIDNEMINLTLGLIQIEQGQRVDINVLVSESAMFAPYTITNEATEQVTVNGKTYECVKYTAKYAGFSLFTAKASYLWYTNDENRVLVKYESGSQIMTLKEVIETQPDDQWLYMSIH